MGRTTSVASSTWTTRRPSPRLPRLPCASRRATHLWPLRPPPEPTPPLSVCVEQLGNWISHYPPIHPPSSPPFRPPSTHNLINCGLFVIKWHSNMMCAADPRHGRYLT